MKWLPFFLVPIILALPCPTLACSICNFGDVLSRLTLRQEAELPEAQMILFGTLSNPRVGATDLTIVSVVRPHTALGTRRTIEIARYLPADAKDPPKYLIFCDVSGKKIDGYRGVPVKSIAVVDYLKGAMALKEKDRTTALLYFFRFLDHADKEIANDAFLEFAKANDQEIGQVAPKLAPEKLRAWLQDADTPTQRLGLYAFLLGACGGNADAAILKSLMNQTNNQGITTFDGLLAGYIQLRPEEGWDLALSLLGNEKKPFAVRFAVIRTLRLYYSLKPQESRLRVLRFFPTVLPQRDLADLAIEDLRRWQLWDLTKDVLSVYGKKSHDFPLMRQAILRYALSCPKEEAATFVAERRREDPELVKDIEEGLRAEKK